MSQQPFQSQAWNHQQQQEELMQQQQHRYILSTPNRQMTLQYPVYQSMQPEYLDGSNQRPLYRDVLMNSQHELQQSQQYQPSPSLLQLPTSPPTYPISELSGEQTQQQQNLFMHQQRQQQWLSHSRQHGEQTPNELFMPMEFERQNSVPDTLGFSQIEQPMYYQSQVCSSSEIIPHPSQSQKNIHQEPPLQSSFGQLGNRFPHQSSQMKTDEQFLQSQIIGYQREKSNK
ncbi:3791_t:CDS:2, partial [Paraglomus brasilianum]